MPAAKGQKLLVRIRMVSCIVFHIWLFFKKNSNGRKRFVIPEPPVKQ